MILNNLRQNTRGGIKNYYVKFILRRAMEREMMRRRPSTLKAEGRRKKKLQ
jgi:hypothetical protein